MGGELVPQPSSFSGPNVRVGRALDWHAGGWGEFSEATPHAYATRQVDTIGGAGEIDMQGMPTLWQCMRNTAVRIVSGAAFTPGCDALEIRYVATPQLGAPTSVEMFITAKTKGFHAEPAEAAAEAACAALPAGFTWKRPSGEVGLVAQSAEADPVLELRQHEDITVLKADYLPDDLGYYTIDGDPGDGSGWQQFFSMLAQVSRPVAISILLQATDLAPVEHEGLAAITSDLALFAEGYSDVGIIGQQVYRPPVPNARVALDDWIRRQAQLQRPLLARVAIRASLDVGSTVASALASAIALNSTSRDKTHPLYMELPTTPRDVRQAAFSFDWLEILPWGGLPLWEEDDAPLDLRRLPYLYGVNAAAGLALLPVPDEQGVPGFQRARRVIARRSGGTEPVPNGPGVVVGAALHHGEPAGDVALPLSAINRHVLIVGAPGSGKTTTVLSILAELWRSHRVPFLVIEPVKTEYRSLLDTPGLEDLCIVSLGRDDISPLRLNPLAPPPGVRREVHANSVMSSMKMALPLPPPLPQLLEDALDRVYELSGWGHDTSISDGIAPPTIRGLLGSFEGVFEQQGYVGDARNIASAVRVRLRSLLRGSRGLVLDTVESVDFESLMSRPVIVELDEIADVDDKALLSAFVLDRIRAAAKARTGPRGALMHVTVLEEAHRLLARASVGALDAITGANTRAESVRAFCEAIAELRSVGEGFILSSQTPSALAEAAVANAGTRVLHRLESAADRDVMLNDLDASMLDRGLAARLRRGEAVMRWPERDDAEVILVRPASGVDSARVIPDSRVAQHMAEESHATRSLLPYGLCTRNVCSNGCEPTVRAEGRRVAAGIGPQARRLWIDNRGTSRALAPIVSILADETDRDEQLTYCAAAHLAVADDAFTVRRRVDIGRNSWRRS